MRHHAAVTTAPVVVRDDDPRRPGLERDGLVIVSTSWGAHHVDHGPAHLDALIARADAEVAELGPADADELLALDAATCADFPTGPATSHEPLTPATARAAVTPPSRAFGARVAGRLVAVTVVDVDGTQAETAFTATAREHRGRGLGAAVKALAVRTLRAEGVSTLRTGGARENAASLAVNRAVGYVVDETWLTYGKGA